MAFFENDDMFVGNTSDRRQDGSDCTERDGATTAFQDEVMKDRCSRPSQGCTNRTVDGNMNGRTGSAPAEQPRTFTIGNSEEVIEITPTGVTIERGNGGGFPGPSVETHTSDQERDRTTDKRHRTDDLRTDDSDENVLPYNQPTADEYMSRYEAEQYRHRHHVKVDMTDNRRRFYQADPQTLENVRTTIQELRNSDPDQFDAVLVSQIQKEMQDHPYLPGQLKAYIRELNDRLQWFGMAPGIQIKYDFARGKAVITDGDTRIVVGQTSGETVYEGTV